MSPLLASANLPPADIKYQPLCWGVLGLKGIRLDKLLAILAAELLLEAGCLRHPTCPEDGSALRKHGSSAVPRKLQGVRTSELQGFSPNTEAATTGLS